MGQIVAENAKPKRCNRRALETGGSLAEVALQNGEYVLVSSDNTVSQSGNGIFDSYVVGDGTTLGKNLPVHNILDKTYDTSVFSGLGHQITPKNIQTISGVEKNILTQEMINEPNTIYRIQYDYDLNGQTITPPVGCVLYFDGGSLTNGTINGDVNVQGEYLSTLNAQVFAGGINFNLYQDDSAIKTSFIGMIPNDSTAAVYNKRLLVKIINSGKNVIMDDFYYIDHSEYITLSRELVIDGVTDNAGMIFTSSLTDRRVFSMNAGSALKLRSLSLICNAFSYLVLNQQIDYLINSVVIQDCKIENGWRIQITGANADYSQTKFGIKDFIFSNNTIRNSYSLLVLTDIVISDRAIISDNIVTNMVNTFFNIGTSNSYTYSEENLKKYSAPLYVERNIVFGGISDTTGYNTFLLAENSTVYYRYNHIENVLNVGSGVAYDGYVSSTNYYCEGNYFKNIATIPKSGTAKATPDEIGKSKGTGAIRHFNNNLWIQDYDEIKNILSESYSEYSSMDSSVYEPLSYITIFRYTGAQEKIVFTNNKISINAGKLKNITSTTASLGIVRIENNIFDCSVEGCIIAPRDNTSVYIENNEFRQHSSSYFVYTSNAYTLDELCVRGNVFNGTYGHSTGDVQRSYKVDVSNNTFIGNLDLGYYLHLPNAINNDGYVETKVSPTADARGIYFFNKLKGVIYFSTVSRGFVVPPSNSTYIKHTLLYNDIVLIEFYIEKNGDVCNVYDKNLIFEKAISSNYTVYYVDDNIRVQIMKSCTIVVNKVNATYCEVHSEVLQAFPQKSFPAGVTANRPANVATGYQYFDTTLGKPIYYNGTSWVDATGATV